MVFNAPFNNISVSFIGGENWSTLRKPLTCRKSLTNLSHNVVSSTPKEEFFYRKCNFSRKIKICRKIIFVKRT